MTEIPGIVWLIVGIMITLVSLWLGNKNIILFIIAGGVMVLVGLLKMVVKRKEKKEMKAAERPQQQPQSVKYCHKCGTALMAIDQFCHNCGSRVFHRR